jgi:hypothetical protein
VGPRPIRSRKGDWPPRSILLRRVGPKRKVDRRRGTSPPRIGKRGRAHLEGRGRVSGRLFVPAKSPAVTLMRTSDVTQLLAATAAGDPRAAAELLPLVYDELRALAAARMASETPGHTLDSTALVHESYLRLVGDQQFDGRGHFFAAAEAMRRKRAGRPLSLTATVAGTVPQSSRWSVGAIARPRRLRARVRSPASTKPLPSRSRFAL